MNEDDETEETNYHFIKNNAFRTIFCDGVFGGLRPDGNLLLTVYAERQAIPQMVVLETRDGNIVREIKDKRVGKDGIVCDVEANLIFDIDTAVELYAWLQSHLDQAVESGLLQKEEATVEAP